MSANRPARSVPAVIPSQRETSVSNPLRSRTRQDFISTVGNLCRRLGFPRSVGQIYGLLFFSARPLSLDEIAAQLEISKASTSMGARQLVAWGAIRQIWIPGDRRDYFQLASDPATMLLELYREFLKPRLGVAGKRLTEMMDGLHEDLTGGFLSEEEFDICRKRLEHLAKIQSKLQSAAPILERLL